MSVCFPVAWYRFPRYTRRYLPAGIVGPLAPPYSGTLDSGQQMDSSASHRTSEVQHQDAQIPKSLLAQLVASFVSYILLRRTLVAIATRCQANNW
jgi:hypothetical protein